MRRIVAVVFGVAVLVGAAAPSAGAVPDPATAISCLTGSAGELTGLIDPAAPGLPAELPGVACLAP
ncbi:hypothetical protein GCM10010145_51960 [Streptomyces ruber]|uniref:Secreted protein n=2 Tax=Streptomyces TaxID=1883 RepID=A0A918EWD8_9ACTN|nr:hypothetical protein [Streptomyces ruber]GGQ75862.1 hypothetical protein GCM10010145_51960 [Streptomyces ruber]